MTLDLLCALLALTALVLLYLVALWPRWFAVAVTWALIVALFPVAFLLELGSQRARRQKPSEAEMERRLTIGMRSARRRGLLPEDIQ